MKKFGLDVYFEEGKRAEVSNGFIAPYDEELTEDEINTILSEEIAIEIRPIHGYDDYNCLLTTTWDKRQYHYLIKIL